MRDRVILFKIETAAILQQYLYMSGEHSITFTNAINVPLKLWIDDDCKLMCQNLNFPNVPPMCWDESMSISRWIDLADNLLTMPAEEFPDRFKNRLEEIVELTRANLSLNKVAGNMPGYES